jgi:hypothetical protein
MKEGNTSDAEFKFNGRDLYPVGFVRDTGRILNFRRSAGVQETTCILSKALLQIRRPSTVQ